MMVKICRLLNYIGMVLLFIFLSCSEEEALMDNEYLSSYNKIDELSTDELRDYWNNTIADNFILHNVEVYKVVYKSEDSFGQEIQLSGSVLIPETESRKGIISIQHATFFANEEAPSENADFSVVSRKSIFASNGYIVFLPDYQGYGIDQERIHPYHHAETLARASIDMIQASKEMLVLLGLNTNDQLFLAGYSEGAYATAAIQRYLDASNSDLKISGLSIGSGAYDLKSTFDSFIVQRVAKTYSCTPCNAFFIQSYNDIYQFNRPMSYYFQEPYAQEIKEGLLLGKSNSTQIATKLTDDPKQLFTSSFITAYMSGLSEWEEALVENSIQDWFIQQPTLITHNIDDEVAPFFNSENLALLNSSNPKVSFEPIYDTNHFDGIFTWGMMTMDYFNGL